MREACVQEEGALGFDDDQGKERKGPMKNLQTLVSKWMQKAEEKDGRVVPFLMVIVKRMISWFSTHKRQKS